MHGDQLVVADLEAPGISNPGQCTFNDPANLAQAAPMRHTGARQVVLDTTALEPFTISWRPVRAVTVEILRTPPRTAARTMDRRNLIQERQGLHRIVPLSAAYDNGKRRPASVDKEVALRALFRPVRRILARIGPPKTARILWLSITALVQSIFSSRPSRSSNSCRSLFHTPRRCQYRRRRQQVTPEPQPISWGNIHQGMPLCKTKTIPAKQARSSTGGRPLLPGRALCFGNSG